MRTVTIWVLASVFLSLVLFSSCSRVNNDSYEKLKMGMEYEEVKKILGNPDNCNSALRSKKCTWGNDNKYIKIAFIGDRVVFFEGKGL